MASTLLAITTANQWSYTRMALRSLAQCSLTDVDLVVIDDASNDGTVELVKEAGIDVVTKPVAKGLTDSWNIAYRRFKAGAYDHFLLANNDILVPPGSIENMLEALRGHEAVGPLTTENGRGHQREQSLRLHHSIGIDDSDPNNYELVQKELSKAPKPALKLLPYLNGFFFGLNRSVMRYELPDGLLFDAKNVNIGNEDDLFARIVGGKAVCLNSFIFHFKGVTLGNFKLLGRFVTDRELIWQDKSRSKIALIRGIRKFLFG